MNSNIDEEMDEMRLKPWVKGALAGGAMAATVGTVGQLGGGTPDGDADYNQDGYQEWYANQDEEPHRDVARQADSIDSANCYVPSIKVNEDILRKMIKESITNILSEVGII